MPELIVRVDQPGIDETVESHAALRMRRYSEGAAEHARKVFFFVSAGSVVKITEDIDCRSLTPETNMEMSVWPERARP